MQLLMLVSHCGEYMANGLTNAVRHEFVMIANDRQTFVAVRKHSRSFCGVSNVMLVSSVANVGYSEWAYECNSPSIRNDRKVIARHS